MSLGARQDAADPGRRGADRGGSTVPPAARASTPGWRDPRLWIGLLIVAVSVVAGARLLATADDTVAVWAVAADAGPGARLSEADLVAQRVRFADAGDLDSYYRIDETLPADLWLVRGIGGGELLPRTAVGADGQEAGTVELPVAVESDQVPAAVHAGSVVDVYLLGRGGARGRPADGAPILREATVVDAPSVDSSFGSAGGRRQLVLAVPEEDAAAYFTAVSALDAPSLTVVRRG